MFVCCGLSFLSLRGRLYWHWCNQSPSVYFRHFFWRRESDREHVNFSSLKLDCHLAIIMVNAGHCFLLAVSCLRPYHWVHWQTKKSWIGHRFRDLGVPLKMKLSIFTCNPLATYKPATPLGQPLLITSYYVRIMPNIFWIGLGNNRWLQRTATTREVLLYFWSTAEYTKATTNGVDNAMSIVDTKSTNSSWQ